MIYLFFKHRIFIRLIINAIILMFCITILASFAGGQSTGPNYIPLKENAITGDGCKKVASHSFYDSTIELETIPFQINNQGYQKSQQELSMQEWDVIDIPDESYLTEIGRPAVPKVNIAIAIPRDAEFKEVILNPTLLKVVENIDLVPVQEPVPLVKGAEPRFSMDSVTYASDTPYPGIFGKVVRVTGFGYYKVVILETYPVQYIPSQKELKFYDLEGLIRYKKGLNIPGEKFGDGEIEDQLERLILNYSEARTWEVATESELNCLIITADELLDAGDKLANWKTVRGLKSEAIKVSDILFNSKYVAGRDIQEKIRMCIKDMWQNKGIRWLIIIGDANIDSQEDISYFVPPRWSIDPKPYSGYDDGYIPADYYYACLDGDWDQDGDGRYGEMEDEPDLLPELFIGRIPVSDKVKANNIVSAIIEFEQNPTGHSKVILASGNTFSSTPGEETYFKRNVIDPIISDKYDVINHFHEFENNLDYDTFINEMNAGVDAVEYYDHGSPSAWYRNWGRTQFLSFDQVIWDLKQTKNIPMVYAMACSTSRYDSYQYQCIGETFINYIRASNYIGATRVAWGRTDNVGDGLDKRFWINYVNNNYWQAGKALALAKIDLWVCYPEDKLSFKTILEFELFGDPEIDRVIEYDLPPDLAVSSSNIDFSDTDPMAGEEVTVTADVYNIGRFEANDVLIGFYDGDPAGNPDSENKVGECIIDLIPAPLEELSTISDENLPGYEHSTSDTQTWTFEGAPGLEGGVYLAKQREIRVNIDYGVTFSMNPILNVSATGWSNAIPNNGSSWCGIVSESNTGCVLNTYVYELWDITGDYKGWYPSDTAQFSYTAIGQPGDNYGTAQITWNTFGEEIGTHNIYVWIDPYHQILETKKDNNIASASIELAEPPDLVISSSDISFSNNTPFKGEEFTIQSKIHNQGTKGISNVKVDFYDDDPGSGGTLISEKIADFVPPAERDSEAVSAYEGYWYQVVGYHWYDLGGWGAISGENIYIPSQQTIKIEAFGDYGSGEFHINTGGTNATDYCSTKADHFYFMDENPRYITLEPGWYAFLGPFGKIYNPGPPNAYFKISEITAQVETSCTISAPGLHDIYVRIDSDNDIFESNEDNNKAFRSIEIYELPDIAIFPEDVTFSNDNPVQGEEVTITATIHNLINNPSECEVDVLFYDGNPEAEGILIGKELVTILSVQTVFVNWDTRNTNIGAHDIYVKLEVQENDSDESNNIAVKQIEVKPKEMARLKAGSSKRTYLPNEPVTAICEVDNLGEQLNNAKLSISVYKDDDSWRVFNKDNGHLESDIGGVNKSDNDSVWLSYGMYDSYVTRYDIENDTWETLYPPPGISLSIGVFPDNEYTWFLGGYYSRLMYYNKETGEFIDCYDAENHLGQFSYPFQPFIDKRYVWVRESNTVLQRYDKYNHTWDKIYEGTQNGGYFIGFVASDGKYLWSTEKFEFINQDTGDYRITSGLYQYNIATEQWKDMDISSEAGIWPLGSDDDYTWFRSNHGLIRYCHRDDTITIYDTSNGLAGNGVDYMLTDDDGYNWFATDKGVSRYDRINDTWTSFTSDNGLILEGQATIWRILKEGSYIWFDSYSSQNNKINVYDKANDEIIHFEAPEITIGAIDAHNNVWFNTFQEGVKRFTRKGDLVWQKDIVINTEDYQKIEEEISELTESGKYYVETVLTSEADREITQSINYFYRLSQGISLVIQTDKEIYQADEDIPITCKATNEDTIPLYKISTWC